MWGEFVGGVDGDVGGDVVSEVGYVYYEESA